MENASYSSAEGREDQKIDFEEDVQLEMTIHQVSIGETHLNQKASF